MASESGSKDGSKSNGKDRMIIALLIVVVLMGTTLFVMVLDDLKILDPPYPSESTPLSLVEGDVIWTGELNYWMYESETFDYRDLRLYWRVAWVGRYITNELANYTQLSVGSLVTVTRPLTVEYSEDGIACHDLQEIHVTDLLGNGLFERGDYIAFDFAEYGIPEDMVHTVALVCVACEWNQEFSFAVHDGDFYSWESNDLPSDYPWWVYPHP